MLASVLDLPGRDVTGQAAQRDYPESAETTRLLAVVPDPGSFPNG